MQLRYLFSLIIAGVILSAQSSFASGFMHQLTHDLGEAESHKIFKKPSALTFSDNMRNDFYEIMLEVLKGLKLMGDWMDVVMKYRRQ